MRGVLVVLLVANILLFVSLQGWLAGWPGGSRALPPQVNPERLEVVPIERLNDARRDPVPYSPPARS